MHKYARILESVRHLPTPDLTGVVASRFIFGFALGAMLANMLRRPNWNAISSGLILGAVALALPGGTKVLRELRHAKV